MTVCSPYQDFLNLDLSCRCGCHGCKYSIPLYLYISRFIIHIYPTKLRTVRVSARSHVIVQLSLYQCKGFVTRLLQSGVEFVLMKTGHEPSGGQIVKSQEIRDFMMLSCWITSSNRNNLSRSNWTQTLILCK